MSAKQPPTTFRVWNDLGTTRHVEAWNRDDAIRQARRIWPDHSGLLHARPVGFTIGQPR